MEDCPPQHKNGIDGMIKTTGNELIETWNQANCEWFSFCCIIQWKYFNALEIKSLVQFLIELRRMNQVMISRHTHI